VGAVSEKYKRRGREFHRGLDGLYSSYWTGRLINMLVKKGLKKAAAKRVYTAFLNLKMIQHVLPVLYLFEILDQIKPVFKLDNCFPGRTKVVFPRIVMRQKQYMVALHWLKGDILEAGQYSARDGNKFSNVIYSRLLDIHGAPRHTIIKKRNAYLKEAIKLQANVRFTWPWYN